MANITQQDVLSLFTVIGAISNSDQILLHGAQGNSAVKITAEIFRAYLNQGFTITINQQGFWTVGGVSTGVQATPMLRNSNGNLQMSTNNGYSWTTLIPVEDLMPTLTQAQINSLKLTFSDLTQSDIETLQAPATEAAADLNAVKSQTLEAKQAAETAAGAANDAARDANAAVQLASQARNLALQIVQDASSAAYDASTAATAANARARQIVKMGQSHNDIEPGPLYVWQDPVTALALDKVEGQVGVQNEYKLQFTVSGSAFTLTGTLMTGVRWVDEPDWEDGYTYQVSIENGLGIAAGWEAAGS